MTVEPGGSGLPLDAGQFLKKRPFDGDAPEQMTPLVGVSRRTVMLETVRLPLFWRAICHVPVMMVFVTLSEIISTPFTDGPSEPVDVKVVPLEGLEELDT